MEKKADRKLISSEAVAVRLDKRSEEMAIALSAANMGSWRWTIATDEVKALGNLLNLYGLPTETFSSKFIELFAPIHSDDVDVVKQKLNHAIEQHVPYECQFRVIWPNGQVRWLLERGQTAYGENDSPLRVTGAALDVTECIESQAAQAESEERLRCIIDNSLDAIIVIDESGKVVEWNRAAESMFGWPKAAALGLNVHELIIPPQYRDRHVRGMQLLRESGEGIVLGQRLTLTALRRDGSEFPIEIALSRSRLMNGKSIFSSSIKDTSRRMQAESQLRRSQDRLSFTLDAAEAGVWEADMASGDLWMSALAAERYGWPAEECVRDLEEVFERMHPDDRQWVREQYEKVAAGEKVSGAEYRVVWPDGQVRWLLSQGRAFSDKQGESRKVFGITLDVTESKEVEEALRQSEEDFRLLLESMTDYAVIVLTQEGCIETWSKGAEDIFGYLEEDVQGKDLGFTMLPDERHEITDLTRQILDAARNEGRAVLNHWAVRKNGTRFFATGMAFPLWKGRDLRGFVKIIRDETQQRESEDKMAYLANHDPLTGLPNRAALSNRLHTEIARARREDKLLALMVLDLDRFKAINDTKGHHIGDLLLKEVALRLLTCVRETDMVARIGGDEFVILAYGFGKVDDAGRLAQKIIDELSRPYLLEGVQIHSGASIGIALFPTDATESIDLMKYADLALYQAKERGRQTYQHFSQELYAEALKRVTMEEGLRQALKNNEFKLVYQPIVDISSSEVYGVETLIRWETSRQQVLTPNDFIAVAEESGLIVEIGEWVLRSACSLVVTLQQQKGVPPFHLAVNVSARQIKEPGFPQMVQQVLKDTGLEPSLLDLELTESLMMNEANKALLQELKRLGVQLVIDDFGTGFSTLSYIRQVAIDGIKVDKIFIDHVAHSRTDNAIVGAGISLAKNLGVRVVAEGVETLEQLAFLKSQGCTSAQGFLISEPVEAESLVTVLQEGNWPRMSLA